MFVLYKNRKKIEIEFEMLTQYFEKPTEDAGNITGKLIAARTACLDVGEKTQQYCQTG